MKPQARIYSNKQTRKPLFRHVAHFLIQYIVYMQRSKLGKKIQIHRIKTFPFSFQNRICQKLHVWRCSKGGGRARTNMLHWSVWLQLHAFTSWAVVQFTAYIQRFESPIYKIAANYKKCRTVGKTEAILSLFVFILAKSMSAVQLCVLKPTETYNIGIWRTAE